MSNFNWRRVVAVAGVLLLATAGTAFAQLTTGNLYGTVTDNQGESLPGVTVSLTGQGAPQIQVTNAEGQFRFLGLSPGGYELKAELEGFSTVDYPNITIGVGRNTTIEVSLSAAVEETITVTSESPLLDERKVSTGTTVTQVELEKIPTARDPWVILQSVPGVLVDRINVGGAESGQQSNFVGNGTGSGSASWAVDGVVVTDPAARGSSPTYYNFDAFEEMAISTGGSDINALTAGVQLNLVTKRGTNQWRVSGRYLVTDSEWQSDPSISSSTLGAGGPWNNNNPQPPIGEGDATDSVDDYGLDIGGPVVKDRLWVWGSYSEQKIAAFKLGANPGDQIPDDTDLLNYAVKLNAQLASSNSGLLFYHYGDKQKSGRNAGPTRPVETTWDQEGPTDIWKLEDTHIFSSNFYLTGLASYVGGGFQLVPKGGLGTDGSLNMTRDANRVWHNSFVGYFTERPQDQYKIDGSYFFNTGSANHELKFGVGYRYNRVTSTTIYPGQGLLGLANNGNFGTATNPQYLGVFVHDYVRDDEFEQWNLYAQDTITAGNLTVNVGLRYDIQTPNNLEVQIPASRAFPNLIGDFTKPGGDPGFEWKTLSPRVGLTYALGEERKTLLRASYSRFADQMGTGFFSDLGNNIYKTGYFWWYNSDFDNIIDPGEAVPFNGIAGDRSVIANRVDPGLDPAITDEIVLGIEHALLPEFVVGATVTLRETTDGIQSDTLVVDGVTGEIRPHTRADYSQVGFVRGTLPGGQAFNQPVYALNVARDPARGFLRQNTSAGSDYTGIALTFNKRLANRWMLRGFFNFSDWTNENIEVNQQDPTRGVNSVDGSQVLIASAGSGNRSETWISSKWSYNVSGLYQIAPDRPWGFNVAADINGREGFAIPYRVSVSGNSALTGDTLGRTVLVSPDNDTFRNDDIFMVNARIEKDFNFSDFGLTIGVDAFNLFNDNSKLQTEGFVTAQGVDLGGNVVGTFNSNNSGWARETISPRIFRIGVRFSWN